MSNANFEHSNFFCTLCQWLRQPEVVLESQEASAKQSWRELGMIAKLELYEIFLRIICKHHCALLHRILWILTNFLQFSLWGINNSKNCSLKPVSKTLTWFWNFVLTYLWYLKIIISLCFFVHLFRGHSKTMNTFFALFCLPTHP